MICYKKNFKLILELLSTPPTLIKNDFWWLSEMLVQMELIMTYLWSVDSRLSDRQLDELWMKWLNVQNHISCEIKLGAYEVL